MRLRLGSEAVSSVIGTVLILAITVATFGGISVVVLREVEQEREMARVDLHIKSAGGQYVIKHRGGDLLPADQVVIRIEADATLHAYALTQFGVGPEWTIGESIALSEVFDGVPQAIDVLFRGGGGSRVLAATGDLVATTGPGAGPSGGASGSGGVSDPGFPFLDVDGNGLYIQTADIAIAASDVLDGTYDAGSRSLVVPPSTGSISAPSILFQAGGDITIAVPVQATAGTLTIASSSGGIVLEGVTVRLDGNTRTASLSGAQFVSLSGTSVAGQGTVSISGGRIDAVGASITTTSNVADISFSSTGDVDVSSATLGARRALTFSFASPSEVLQLDGASFQDSDNRAIVSPSGVIVQGALAAGTWSYG